MLPIVGACALEEIGALLAGVFWGVLRSKEFMLVFRPVACAGRLRSKYGGKVEMCGLVKAGEEATYGAVTSRLPGI